VGMGDSRDPGSPGQNEPKEGVVEKKNEDGVTLQLLIDVLEAQKEKIPVLDDFAKKALIEQYGLAIELAESALRVETDQTKKLNVICAQLYAGRGKLHEARGNFLQAIMDYNESNSLMLQAGHPFDDKALLDSKTNKEILDEIKGIKDFMTRSSVIRWCNEGAWLQQIMFKKEKNEESRNRLRNEIQEYQEMGVQYINIKQPEPEPAKKSSVLKVLSVFNRSKSSNKLKTKDEAAIEPAQPQRGRSNSNTPK
jgi:tetratricopeptide (TPR) repeat protein